MNARLLSAFLLALPAAAAPVGKIQFFNRDQISGNVDSIAPDLILWNSPMLEKPAPFKLDKILELNLQPGAHGFAEGYEAVVSLTNGDTLRGQISSVTDDVIELETWFAGKLKLSRPDVKSVTIEELPTLIFRGPESLDGWTLSGSHDNAWTYEGGALVSSASGSIARDVKLPDKFRLAFNLEWHGTFRLRLACGATTLDEDPPALGYNLAMQDGRVRFRKYNRNNQRPPDRNVNVTDFVEKERATIELRGDRKKGVFNLIVDGRSVGIFSDADLKDIPSGGVIQFISEQSQPLRISHIGVSVWDGVVEPVVETEDLDQAEQQEKAAEKPPETEAGRMVLRNGDSLAGEVLGINNGVMKVKTRFDEIDLPVSRLRTIALKPASPETPKLRNGDIRAWFDDGTRVVFRLDSATPETLTGFSQNFGTATFKISAFSRIEFNLYDPAFQALRGEKNW